MRHRIFVALLALLLAACASGSGDEATTTTTPPDSSTLEGPLHMSTTTSDPGDGVAVPSSVTDAAIARAVEDTGLDAEDFEVIEGHQVVWNDSSLGCPEDGKAYLQVLTDGYWVVLQGPDEEYDYRSGLETEFRRCIGGQEPSTTLVDK